MELSELLTHFGIYAVASSTSSQTKNATTTSNTAATATIESRPVESRPVERFFSPNDCANRGGICDGGNWAESGNFRLLGGDTTLPLPRDDRPVIFAGNVYAANYVCETASYD